MVLAPRSINFTSSLFRLVSVHSQTVSLRHESVQTSCNTSAVRHAKSDCYVPHCTEMRTRDLPRPLYFDVCFLKWYLPDSAFPLCNVCTIFFFTHDWVCFVPRNIQLLYYAYGIFYTILTAPFPPPPTRTSYVFIL